ncbi:FUSC family protein [Gordonia insulae]|uniref:Inner membrane protein YccS n=1 Tax=Gordonia insulae TaxID=2420509 RepID=A0A3G8JHL7_9ACTN|nr:FUSC family protein [Gordonia insulae]AZG44587.1 Inner membrane protein YccS [Gordonia insulae]
MDSAPAAAVDDRSPLSRLRAEVAARDPGLDAFRRAVRPAVVVPIAAAVGLLFGGTATPLYAIFGSFALLVMVDFPGNRARRATSFAVLGVVGYAFVAAGSVLAHPGWLATGSMLVVGVVVSYVTILSSSFAAAQRAALLLFVLPVASPPGPVPDRLLGWTIALAVSVPAALYLLPPRHYGELRRRARAVCATLADLIGHRDGDRDAPDPTTVTIAMNRLREVYLGSDFRPSGMTAGSRALIRVVDDLEWLVAQVRHFGVRLPTELRGPVTDVLRSSAVVLDTTRPTERSADRAALEHAADTLRALLGERTHINVDTLVADPSEADAEAESIRMLHVHTTCSTVALIGRTIAWSSAADARPALMKIFGRQLTPTGAADRVLSEPEATRKSLSPRVFLTSVIARNALRTGVGLAGAVAMIQVVPVQHGFWVVLGAMSVLRTSALATGSTVLKAVLGTIVGFAIGALVVSALGTNEVALWIVLPVAAFGAAYVPQVASFAAGQASFTVMVVTLFNVLHPSGWKIGLVRVEDIALGCAVAVVASVILWPRGLASTARAAIDSATAAYVRYLGAATEQMTRGVDAESAAEVARRADDSVIAYRTSNDAARQYLSESGGSTDARTPVVRKISQANRIRVVADSIADLLPIPASSRSPRVCAVLERHTALVSAELMGDGVADLEPIAVDVVAALRADAAEDPANAQAAVPLVAAAAYLGELEVRYTAASTTPAS